MLSQTLPTLRDVPLFNSLPDDQIATLEQYCTWRKHGEDDVVLSMGHNDRADVFFVIAGQVRMAVQSGAAGEIVFFDLGPGDMFGELAALDDDARPITVVALGDCTLAALPHARFRDCLFEHRYAAQYMLRHLAAMARLLAAPAEAEGNRSMPRRVFSELLRRCTPDPRHEGAWQVAPVPPAGELARSCGVSDAVELEAIAHLAGQGLIRDGGDVLRVLDRDRLECLVGY
ncbi:Crp/Fnr family transcriptional regulator [Futiania mangrovi]|uniref:Crp/Fnr family transcriptional regulator n=1 Tax=Futiania mangrovi TaxID=2959716 RepID=A0A9J6PGD8_9PROT|nr:Crp/Fnr family transcriptional regulator [Futiania mangrovii]MCP1336867.1 Crp/Fnr family transcriptional regulator [Futiania mangrovii]